MIETYTGREFDYDAPTPDMVHVTDIARSLAQQPRFAGHTREDYSVAQHALLVRALVRQAGGDAAMQLAALHHDSHEAYLMDLPSPLKRKVRAMAGDAYDVMRDDIDYAIARAFGIDQDLFHDPVVKQADADALLLEAQALKRSAGRGTHWAHVRNAAPDALWPPFFNYRAASGSERGARAFHAAHRKLTGEINA